MHEAGLEGVIRQSTREEGLRQALWADTRGKFDLHALLTLVHRLLQHHDRAVHVLLL